MSAMILLAALFGDADTRRSSSSFCHRALTVPFGPAEACGRLRPSPSRCARPRAGRSRGSFRRQLRRRERLEEMRVCLGAALERHRPASIGRSRHAAFRDRRSPSSSAGYIALDDRVPASPTSAARSAGGIRDRLPCARSSDVTNGFCAGGVSDEASHLPDGGSRMKRGGIKSFRRETLPRSTTASACAGRPGRGVRRNSTRPSRRRSGCETVFVVKGQMLAPLN